MHDKKNLEQQKSVAAFIGGKLTFDLQQHEWMHSVVFVACGGIRAGEDTVTTDVGTGLLGHHHVHDARLPQLDRGEVELGRKTCHR